MKTFILFLSYHNFAVQNKKLKLYGLKLLITLLALCGTLNVFAQDIDSLFAHVPRTILPSLDNTARLDLLDLYNNGLPAKAENTLGGQAELLEKKKDKLLLRTSGAGTWLMQLLPTGHDTLICCIYSIKAGGTSSRVTLYQRNWHISKHDAPYPDFDQLYNSKNTLSAIRAQSIQATLREAPIAAYWSDTDHALIFKIDTSSLCEEDKKYADKCTREAKYYWSNGAFSQYK